MKKKTFCLICTIIGLLAIIATFLIMLCVKNNQVVDYEYLHSQKQLIKSDFNNVYSLEDYTIEEDNNKIVVTLNSGSLSSTCLFDKEHNFIEEYSTISLVNNHVFSTFLIALTVLIISLTFTVIFAGMRHLKLTN